MKILVTINSLSDLSLVAGMADGVVIFNDKVSARYESSFSFDEIKELLKQASKLKLETYIMANAIFDDSNTKDIYELVNEFKTTQLNYIYADLAFFEVLKENQIVRKGVYNPNTLITNYYDFTFWDHYKVKGLFPSLEIPVDDINVIGMNRKRKLYYQGFGYAVMFQSKRMLLSAFEEEKGLVVPKTSNNLYIKEETRNDTYKIIENSHGTHIYQTGIHNVLPALDIICDNIDYLFLDGSFIEKDKFIKAIEIYNEAICDIDHVSKYNKELETIFDNLSYDFLYEDSVFKKGDF